ncbi:MAG TPA: universal stress protein [Burkholderiaceae bacterium]|jgi:nucleotide-binding universal stress UspA family protein|nr:universal stress protein [Burkholderiaceae bacterium]
MAAEAWTPGATRLRQRKAARIRCAKNGRNPDRFDPESRRETAKESVAMYSRILVPVDGSAPSGAGLKEAIALAKEGQSTIVVLNVVSELPLITGSAGYVGYGELADLLAVEGRRIADAAAAQVEKAGVKVETQVVDVGVGPVCDTIVDQATRQRCGLIVMGTHGRRGMKRLTLGSDAELVVRHAAVPVLLVKAPDGAQ